MNVKIFTVKINVLHILLLLVYTGVYSQTDSSKYVKYSPEYIFREGFYLSFKQVLDNNPIPKSRVITNFDYNDPDFFDKILQKDKIYFYDHLGNSNELRTRDIWGYSRNGFLYIKMDNGFFRITMVGSISHFIASETVYRGASPGDYYAYSPYYDPYYRMPYSNETTEVRQYLLDFNTGNVFLYDENSFRILLMRDPTLHDEYMALSRKKRKQQIFMYLRKFNERHPLYFPKN